MISCTEFIPAYSEGFKFIEQKEGRTGLEKFWSVLSDIYLKDTLENLIKEEGLEGCYIYWSDSLNEEAAGFRMVLDEIEGKFTIDMLRCPSKYMLNEYKHIEAYHAYCDHCRALYRPVVERYGYNYKEDLSGCHNTRCSLTITYND